MDKFNIAVIGATGLVGRTALEILDRQNFPLQNIYAVASSNSAGTKIVFGKKAIIINSLREFNFQNVDIALFCVNSNLSREFVPKAISAGCLVIDNSSYFRMDKDVPLIVPEVNIHEIKNIKNIKSNVTKNVPKNIIANPNCVAIPLAVAVAPLHKKFRVKRIIISTYQSVSGAGQKAVKELHDQTQNIFTKRNLTACNAPAQIAFNLIPQIGPFEENSFTEEENKICNEIQKIIDPKIKITANCVRVPVFFSHSMSANIEFENPVCETDIIKELQIARGVTVVDTTSTHNYISPIDAAKTDFVYVSRIRKDPSISNGIAIWIVADNIRKGAALNAIQIAKQICKQSDVQKIITS